MADILNELLNFEDGDNQEDVSESSEMIETEKDSEKVDKKKFTRKNRSSKQEKACKVLCFIKSKNFIIIDFDGCNIRIDGIQENPGEFATVEFSGKIGTSGFEIEMK